MAEPIGIDLPKLLSSLIATPGISDTLLSLLGNLGGSKESQADPAPEEEGNALAEVSAGAEGDIRARRARREALLRALRPYLKEGRRAKIESLTRAFAVIELLETRTGEV